MIFSGARSVPLGLLALGVRAVGVLAAVVAVCGLWAVALAGSAAAALPPGCVQSGSTVTCTFSETGGSQSWTVPSGVSLASFVVDGASGGASADGSEAGGDGGQVSATLGALSAGQVFTIEVGGTGSVSGFNGGGSGGGDGAGGGGGSSSVNLGSTVELVAGGGGGGAEDVTGNYCTGPVTTTSGAGGAGGQFGVDGNPGGTFTCSTETLGGGGDAGGDQSPLVPGAGGAAGEPDGTAISLCGSSPGFIGGDQGGSATGSTGGNGATGAGGGGGGFVGGGGGGSPAHDVCALTGGRAGGGGGSSYAASAASGVLFATGVSVPGASGNGQATITYSTPPAYQPDAQIKLASDTSYLGVGIVNTTGAGQTRSTTTARGKSATFDLRFVNAGTHSDAIAVKGCKSSSGFTVKYLKGTTDVTTTVTADMYKTGKLAAGASQVLKLKIAVSSTATAGKVDTCKVTATSVGAPTREDVVKAKVKVG